MGQQDQNKQSSKRTQGNWGSDSRQNAGGGQGSFGGGSAGTQTGGQQAGMHGASSQGGSMHGSSTGTRASMTEEDEEEAPTS